MRSTAPRAMNESTSLGALLQIVVHVIGLDVFVQRGDRLAEEGRPRRLCEAERQVLPQPPPAFVGELEQLSQGKRLDVGGAEQAGDRELVPGEVALELERGRAHRRAGYGDGRVRPDFPCDQESGTLGSVGRWNS
jgi:hypothetical protein